MLPYIVFFLGEESSGKTALWHRLAYGTYKEDGIRPTIGLDFRLVDFTEHTKIQFWDTSKEVGAEWITRHHPADVYVYALDLSKPLDVKEAKAKIVKMKEEFSKNATLKPSFFLVGTKIDDEKAKDNLAAFDALLAEPGLVDAGFKTSVKTKEGIEDLEKKIQELALLKCESPKDNQTDSSAKAKGLRAMNEAIALLKHPSQLRDALRELQTAMQELSTEKYNAISQETLKLTKTLTCPIASTGEESELRALHQAILTFESNCKKVTASPSILKALGVVLAAVLVTVLAAVAGFAIGFALGIWSGPGAFFSALAISFSAASKVGAAAYLTLGVSAALGAIGGGFAYYGFFEKSRLSSPEQKVETLIHDKIVPIAQAEVNKLNPRPGE